jgi:hypothetical protein
VPESDQVGDPAADRRIRNVILALGALALIVLITTIIFWRKTKPVPAPLDGLRRLGSRSGRRAARAVEAAGVAPPSVAGEGVARAGVDVRPATAGVADRGASSEVAASPDVGAASAVGASPVVAASSDVGTSSAVAASSAGAASPEVGTSSDGPSSPDGPASSAVAASSDVAAASDLPATSDGSASSDGPSRPPAAEVVPASAPPPAPGTSLREDG